jgi:DNA-binding response OmpR family regulator
MTVFHLLIPDTALREAVVEQLHLASLGTIVEDGALPAAPPQEMVVILDEVAVDPKLIKKLQTIKNDTCIVFLLGAMANGVDESLVTEIFPKPVRLGHLLGRLHFYLEIAPKLRASSIMIGAYKLEATQRSLTRGDEIVRLTEKETALLEYLAQSPNPVGREELLAGVWGYDARIDTHTLETHIYQLRRKIGSELILNENGQYRLTS